MSILSLPGSATRLVKDSHQMHCVVFLILLLGTTPVTANTQFSPVPGSCQIIGDPDVYGKGIRLSYYLQWVSVLFGIWIAPESTSLTRTATNIVTLSVFINSLRGAGEEHSLMVVEWYIVQYLVFWLLAFNLPTSQRDLHSSAGSLFVLLINYCIVITFPVWLYWRGNNLGRKEGCEPLIFLFHSIRAYNPKWLLASKVLATMSAVVVWVPLFGSLILLWFALASWNKEEEEDEEGDSGGTLALQFVFTLLVLSNGASAIAFTEKTIAINNIVFPNSNLTDSGQLIPLLIGIFTLTAVFWEGLKKAIRLMR